MGGEVRLELATTPLQLRQGLMYRRRLARDRGMLLAFPATGRHPIWMRNVRVPLDVVYLDVDQVVLDVVPRQPGDETLVAVDRTRYVLELAAGVADELGIERGTRLRWW